MNSSSRSASMMRKRIVAMLAAIVAALVLLLTPAAANASVSGYRQWVASQGISPTPTVMRLGKTICHARSHGMSWNAIAAAGMRAGVSSRTIAIIMVGSVYELCPQQIASFSRWVNS